MDVKDLQSEWNWARGLTLDLLKASSDYDLGFELNKSCGPLWKQFRHIARVHENYLQALETKKIAFGTDGCTYDGDSTKANLIDYFQRLQDQHSVAFQGLDSSSKIDWFGEPKSLDMHFVSLLTHETLHHGQLILYWRALEHKFPESWSDWGE